MEPLPIALESLRAEIEATTRPYVKLCRHPAEQIELTHSKLGGFPYLPYSLSYPIDDQGVPLLFIAQINFAEVPPLPDFPQQGILQFFISSIYAQDCTVRYLTDLEEEAIDEANLKWLMEMNASDRLADNPIKRPSKLQFELDWAPPSMTDFRCDRLLAKHPAWQHDNSLDRVYRDWIESSRCHKLGGYGHYVQGDPRDQPWTDPAFPEFELLLQLNSDQENFGLMWGDLQEVCFFIRPPDLRNLDFSSVRYYLCP